MVVTRHYDKTRAERVGFGQVEPNHLSAQKTGQIYAQLPAMKKDTNNVYQPMPVVEQGQFLKYNYVDGVAGVTGDGEWMLCYAEEKHYDERKTNHKDFALLASDFTDGKIYPRLLKTNVGDLFTLNTFGGRATTDKAVTSFGFTPTVGALLEVGSDGYLEVASATPSAPVFQIAKVYDMPDGQMGVKVQRVQ